MTAKGETPGAISALEQHKYNDFLTGDRKRLIAIHYSPPLPSDQLEDEVSVLFALTE